MLYQLRNELQNSRIDLSLARVADRVHDLFERSGFLEKMNGHLYQGVDSAVAVFLAAGPVEAPNVEQNKRMHVVAKHG